MAGAAMTSVAGAATTGSAPATPGATFHMAPTQRPSSGLARPDSASGCSGGLPLDQWELCIIIIGTGTWTTYIEGDAYTYGMYLYGHLELHGPAGYVYNGPNVVWNNTTVGVLHNQLDTNMTPGTYCVSWWEDTGGGHYTLFNSACDSIV